MKNGDLSNVVQPRLMVTLDVVATVSEGKVSKTSRLLRRTDAVPYTVTWDWAVLTELFSWGWSRGVNIELAVIESGVNPAQLEDELDARGTNPFSWISTYATVEDLVNDLPWRNDLYGVLDTPERSGRYGTFAVERLP